MKLTLPNFGSLINCRNVTLTDLLIAKVSCFIPHRRDTVKFLEKLTFKLISKYFQLSCSTKTQKTAKISSKNIFQQGIHSIHTESRNASDSINFSQIHVTIFPSMTKLFHSLIKQQQQQQQPAVAKSLWRRATALNASFQNYFTVTIRSLSTRLTKPNFHSPTDATPQSL